MNLQKFTVKAQEAVQAALELAASLNHQGIEPPHLMKAFLSDEGSVVRTLLSRLNANLDFITTKTDQTLDKLPKVSGSSWVRSCWRTSPHRPSRVVWICSAIPIRATLADRGR